MAPEPGNPRWTFWAMVLALLALLLVRAGLVRDIVRAWLWP